MRTAIVNMAETTDEIDAARATIQQLMTERNTLDKNSSTYVQMYTNMTNDIVASKTLLNTLISQQGNCPT